MTYYLITIALIIVFTGYTTYIYKLFGVIPSISDSYYFFREKGPKVKASIFTIFAMALAACLVGIFVALTNESLNPLRALPFLLSGASAGFLAVAPAFKIKSEGKIHVIAASSLIGFGFIGLITAFGAFWWLIIFAIIAAVLKYLWPVPLINSMVDGTLSYTHPWHFRFDEIDNITWWIEIAAFVLVITGLILR